MSVIQTFIRKLIGSDFYKLFIREIISNNSYRLLPEKSFQRIPTNYYQIIISNHIYKLFIRGRKIISNSSYKLLPYKSSQTILTNYYQRIISRNTYTLLSQNHFKQYLQPITRESFQAILTNYCQRNHFKQYLQLLCLQKFHTIHSKKYFIFVAPLLQKILWKLRSENSLQTLLSGLAWILKPRLHSWPKHKFCADTQQLQQTL